MSEARPVNLTESEIRNILDGYQTQFRRPIQKQPSRKFQYDRSERVGRWHHILADKPDTVMHTVTSPYGVPGDRLWVREPFLLHTVMAGIRVEYKATKPVVYLGASCNGGPVYEVSRVVPNSDIPSTYRDIPDDHQFRPSNHMQRWASRLLLEVIDVRVQRVSDLTEEEATANGAPNSLFGRGFDGIGPVRVFKHIWDRIVKKDDFKFRHNPWAWVVTFKVVD